MSTVESNADIESLNRGFRSRRLMRRTITISILAVGFFFVIMAISNLNNDEIISMEPGFSMDPLRDKKSYRVIVVGDTGGLPFLETTWSQNDVKTAMNEKASQEDVQLILNMGDNIYFTGAEDEFDLRFKTRFEDVYTEKSLQVPWLMIAGNHDHFGNVTAQIEYTKHSNKWYFPSLYYKKFVEFNGTSIDFMMLDTIVLCGNTRDVQNAGFFEMLTNGSHSPKGPSNKTLADIQWKWIENNFNTSTADYLIVSGHYPIHSMSSHGPTDCLREKLDPLLKKYNINAYLSGHDHTLQHFVYDGNDEHKVHYIVSGAGSRADSSNKFKKMYSDKHLLYHYPPSPFFSWSPASQLGFSKGGFAYIEFGHEEATFRFYEKRGIEIYRSSFPKRNKPIPYDTNEIIDI